MMTKSEYADSKRRQRAFIKVLKQYQEQGGRILMDGVEASESEWERIFEMGEDGGCYMGDYIGNSPSAFDEIHFNKVYLWGPPPNKKRNHK